MANVKLIGLALIITTAFLSLMAMATQTSHIRIHSGATPQGTLSKGGYSDDARGAPMFESIPVALPLGIAAAIGFVLWFTPTSLGKPPKGRYNSRNRGRRQK